MLFCEVEGRLVSSIPKYDLGRHEALNASHGLVSGIGR